MYRVLSFVVLNIIFTSAQLNDITAYVDRALIYNLDKPLALDTKVTEEGHDVLPAWLYVDRASSSIRGVPSIKDRGTYIISVDKDLFALHVIQAPTNEVAEPALSQDKPYLCSAKDSLTEVKVFLNADLQKLSPQRRFSLIEDLGEKLSLNKNHISLRSQARDLLDSSKVLVSGRGDRKHDPLSETSYFSWVVGCGVVKSRQMSILETLEAFALNGSLSKHLKEGVSGWRVDMLPSPIISNRRLKRQVRATNTPVPSVTKGDGFGHTSKVTPSVSTTVKETPTTLSTTPSTLPTTSTTIPTTRLTTTPTTTTTTTTSTTPTTTPTTSKTTASSTTTTPSTSTASTTTLSTTPVTTPTSTPTTVITTTTAKTTPTTTTSSTTKAAKIRATQPPSLPPPITTPPPPRNKAPVLKSNADSSIQIELISGRLETWTVPSNLFSDPDGDTISYAVIDHTSGHDVNSESSWLRFSNRINQLEALPMDNHIGINKYILRASDTKGLSADVSLTLDVKDKLFVDINQFYILKLEGAIPSSDADVLSLGSVLNRGHGEVQISELNVTEHISVVKFGYVDHLSPSVCPRTRIRDVRIDLQSLKELDVSDHQYRVASFQSEPAELCVNTYPYRTSRPSLTKQFSELEVTTGVLFELQVPEDFFVDEEDINLRNMKLSLIPAGDSERKGRSWITLDETDRTIYALTLSNQPPKTYQFTLRATDSGGLSDGYDMEIKVVSKDNTPKHKFSVSIDAVYQEFLYDLNTQIEIYKKLRNGFGGRPIHIYSVKEGSVVVQFSLTEPSLNSSGIEGCQAAEEISKNVFDGLGGISSQFKDALSPYEILKMSFAPLDECEGVIQGQEVILKDVSAIEMRQSSIDLLYVLIPIIIIILVVMLIGVAICLWKRKRQASMKLNKTNGTYIGKGVPIVFEEEMRDMDKKGPAETQPLMDDTDKPKPPAYPQNGVQTTPLLAGSRLYHPPTPPVSDHDENDRSP